MTENRLLELLPLHEKGLRSMISIRMQGTNLAEDICQEVLLAAWMKCDGVRDENALRAWLFQIARNKCADAYRAKGQTASVAPESLSRLGRGGRSRGEPTLTDEIDALSPIEKEAVRLHYLRGLSIRETAELLNVPEGTVKRRIHDARRHLSTELARRHFLKRSDFSMKYPFAHPLTDIRPDILITPLPAENFHVICTEAPWMFESVVPGDERFFGTYDLPDWQLTYVAHSETQGAAVIHGTQGVEVRFTQCDKDANWSPESRSVYLGEVDGEVRTLAASWTRDGIPAFDTYLSPDFDENWNGHLPMRMAEEGRFLRTSPGVYQTANPSASIGAGHFRVTVGGRAYDCLRVLDADEGTLTEAYLLKSGRTLMTRRYNAAMWQVGTGLRYGETPWSERLKGQPTLTLDGATYYHWYDALSDAAFS